MANKELIKRQFQYSAAGLIAGLISIICGAALFLLGITGSTTWVVEGSGVESHLINATPGIFMFLVGLLVVMVTRRGFKGSVQ